tara:strand:- start:384 stop:665 length:282 start_codon:yes stop_codon:yes gene_type:complete
MKDLKDYYIEITSSRRLRRIASINYENKDENFDMIQHNHYPVDWEVNPSTNGFKYNDRHGNVLSDNHVITNIEHGHCQQQVERGMFSGQIEII